MQYPINEEMLKYDEEINSNNFNGYNLHNSTKKNSLYFMMQYMYQKFNFQDQLKIDSQKFMKFSLRL